MQKLGLRALRLVDGEEVVQEPCLLLTYTTGIGQAPPEVVRFVERNRPYIQGVATSGNRNWGSAFARAADVLAERYGLPILHKFELSGTQQDVQIIREVIHEISGTQQRGAA